MQPSSRYLHPDISRLPRPTLFPYTTLFRSATRPRLLLLDEPVAGMGLEESQRMVRLLGGLKGRVTIVLVEHDMDAVFTLADRISVMVYGRIIATGTPEEVRGNAEVRRAYLGEEATL